MDKDTLEYLKSLGISVARGVPQLATGFVDLAALPFTLSGLIKPEQAVGSTDYMTAKGYLPPKQEGLLSETTELLSGAINPAGAVKGGLLGAGALLGTKGIKPVLEALDTSYRGSHAAPNAATYGATIDNLGGIMPADVYSSKGISRYGLGDPAVDREWFSAAYRAKSNPDAEVTVWRAVPKGVKDINSGDWVTTSKTYAKNHGENTLNGEYDLISSKVKAKTLTSEGYPYEFGYHELDEILK
jgi:hypothetical protein